MFICLNYDVNMLFDNEQTGLHQHFVLLWQNVFCSEKKKSFMILSLTTRFLFLFNFVISKAESKNMFLKGKFKKKTGCKLTQNKERWSERGTFGFSSAVPIKTCNKETSHHKCINVFSFGDAVQMLRTSARAALGSRALQCEKLLLRREA